MHLFCLYPFPLIFTNININLSEKKCHFLLLLPLKIVFVIDRKAYFKPNLIFFGMSRCFNSLISFP